MNEWTPFKLKGWCNVLFMVLHAILRQILKYYFCAICLRELSVCAIFYAFYNYGLQCYMYLSLFCPWPSQKTEAQVLYLFSLSNIHNRFWLCALITWYLITD